MQPLRGIELPQSLSAIRDRTLIVPTNAKCRTPNVERLLPYRKPSFFRRPVALSGKSLQGVERFVVKAAAHRQSRVLLQSYDRVRSRRTQLTVDYTPEK